MEEFLYKQAPIIVFMGVVIFWLAKLYIGERAYNKELSTKAVELAKESMTAVSDINTFKASILEKIEALEHSINSYARK